MTASSGAGGGTPEAPQTSASSSTGTGGTTSPTPGSEQMNVSGLQPSDAVNPPAGSASMGAAGAPSGNGASGSTCEPSACAALDIDADGAAEPGCCTMAGACGGQVEFMGMSFCAPPNAAPPITPEPIVSDPRCLAQSFPNPNGGGTISLPGCCDASGICGVSTASLAGADAGIAIPTACLTPTDVAGFGADAGPLVSCR